MVTLMDPATGYVRSAEWPANDVIAIKDPMT